MTLVTSFSPDQLPADGSSKPGYQLLREFVLFAAASGDRDVEQLRADPEMNPFELDVYERLVDAGLRVDTQDGVAGYRLDLSNVARTTTAGTGPQRYSRH